MGDTQDNHSDGTLEDNSNPSGDTLKDNSENFKKPEINYVPVSRSGWGNIGINGGGDPDSVDYRIS